MKHKLKEVGKWGYRKLFEKCQIIGINVLPMHFYSEIPNICELRGDDRWLLPYSMTGIHGIDIAEQLAFIRECCSGALIEIQKKEKIYQHACTKNGESGYGPIEADFLYCFISQKRPKKIVQIGCGVSTAVILSSAEKTGYLPEIICIDPSPTDFLRASDRLKKIKLIATKAQFVETNTLTDLGDNGFLFIDSTHAVKSGSELNRLILEVLPRLRKGCWVHFHDIHFPYGYSRHILSTELFFSNETVLLQSFLANNCKYKLRASLSMLHYANPDELKKYLPNYCPAGNRYGLQTSMGHFPSAAYLEVIA